ncbi:MAG TPA: cellulose binding domain-containing protein, partial [Kofleriaceae bacterium]|nr:cellulose binding domain-containing protein [Kofleriaceae bacterium]
MSHPRARLTSVAVSVLIVAGLAAMTRSAAAATAGCTVTYQSLNAWVSSPTSGGFTTNLAITNLGDPISHWTLTFTVPGGQTVTSGFNAGFSFTPTTVSATDVGWNGSIGTGVTNTSVGIQGTWSRSTAGSAPPNPFPQPTDFTLNGVRCTGSTTGGNLPPTVNLTSPAAGQAFNAPATVNFAATASDADGSVVRVEFLSGSTVIGSDA